MPFPRASFSGCELLRWFKGRVMEWEDSIVFSFHSSPIATNCIWGHRPGTRGLHLSAGWLCAAWPGGGEGGPSPAGVPGTFTSTYQGRLVVRPGCANS